MVDRNLIRIGLIKKSNHMIKGDVQGVEWCCFCVYGCKEDLTSIKKLVAKTLKVNGHRVMVHKRYKNEIY